MDGAAIRGEVMLYSPGDSGAVEAGDLTSLSLAGSQSVADGDTDVVEFDSADEGAGNASPVVTDLATVPAGAGIEITETRKHWVNVAVGVVGDGSAGGAVMSVYRWDGVVSTLIEEDIVISTSIGTAGVLASLKRISLTIGDLVYAMVQNASGGSLPFLPGAGVTFGQAWGG